MKTTNYANLMLIFSEINQRKGDHACFYTTDSVQNQKSPAKSSSSKHLCEWQISTVIDI